MTKQKILQEGQSYSFRSYFELPYDIEEILEELGYSLTKKSLILPLVSLNNETARRETLVSPLLLEVITHC